MNENMCVLGKGHMIEDNTILGRAPERGVELRPLYLGENAKVRSGSVLYACSTIGEGLETGHGVVIREENIIGNRVSIWSYSVIDYGCVLGSDIKVHSLCYIAQFTEVEDGVFIGPGVTVTNDIHPGCPRSRECMRGPRIGTGAVIGGNVTILPMVHIGERALVGAGSVVTKDVPPETVVYGNPARPQGSIYDASCRTKLVERPYYR